MVKALPLVALLILPVAAQDQAARDDSRELRIYLLDFAQPRRSLQDVSASIVLETRSGAAATYLVPLSAAGHAEATPAPIGTIRGLMGTPYFVELVIPGIPPSEWRNTAEATPRAPGRANLSARQVLTRAHQGPWFARNVPSVFFKEPFTATITFRLGDTTVTSEEFQHPAQPTAEAASRALELLKSIGIQAEAGKSYTQLKPMTEELVKELDQLAPAGFQDDRGAVELDRQWCLATARAIGEACDRGNSALVENLSTQAQPRMNLILGALGVTKAGP